MNKHKLYNTETAAEYLGLSTRTIKTYAAQGRLQAQKIGRAWSFTQEALDSFIRGDKPSQYYADVIVSLVPGLADNLRDLRRQITDPETVHKLDTILNGYIKPMETMAKHND